MATIGLWIGRLARWLLVIVLVVLLVRLFLGLLAVDPLPWLSRTLTSLQERAARAVAVPRGAMALSPRWHLDEAAAQEQAAERNKREATHARVYAEYLDAAQHRITQIDSGVAQVRNEYDLINIGVYSRSLSPTAPVQATVYIRRLPETLAKPVTIVAGATYNLEAVPASRYELRAVTPEGRWSAVRPVEYAGGPLNIDLWVK